MDFMRWQSLWTVDLDTPKWAAAVRTVAPVSMMYTASWRERFRMVSVMGIPPMLCCRISICAGKEDMHP